MLLIEVVNVQIFVEKGLVFEVCWKELILFLKEVNDLIVHGFIVFGVFVEFTDKKIKDFVRIVELVNFDD